jgi:hypothetical protein
MDRCAERGWYCLAVRLVFARVRSVLLALILILLMFLCVQITEEAYAGLLELFQNTPKLQDDPQLAPLSSQIQDLLDRTLRPAIQNLLCEDLSREQQIVEAELLLSIELINSSLSVSFLFLYCSIGFEMRIEIFTLLFFLAV